MVRLAQFLWAAASLYFAWHGELFWKGIACMAITAQFEMICVLREIRDRL